MLLVRSATGQVDTGYGSNDIVHGLRRRGPDLLAVHDGDAGGNILEHACSSCGADDD